MNLKECDIQKEKLEIAINNPGLDPAEIEELAKAAVMKKSSLLALSPLLQ